MLTSARKDCSVIVDKYEKPNLSWASLFNNGSDYGVKLQEPLFLGY